MSPPCKSSQNEDTRKRLDNQGAASCRTSSCDVEQFFVVSDSTKCYHIIVSAHDRTLITLWRHPRPSNLRWADVEALLVSLGAVVKEGKGSAVSVSLQGITAYFHRPHPGDKIDKGAVVTVVRLLQRAGFRPGQHGENIHRSSRSEGK
jgi:hypothetical protein